MRLLFQIFNTEIPDGYVVEYPENSGIYHIPIMRVKEMLSIDFVKWGTTDFHFEYLQRGHDCLLSGSISLNIQHEELGCFTFTGCANFKVKVESPNEHYVATLKSECIKNAAKDIGKRYGFYLNQDLIDVETLHKIENGNVEVLDNELKAKGQMKDAVKDVISQIKVKK